MKNEILVAYDFSPMADAALAWAARITRDGSPVKVVYVVALLPYTEGVVPIPPPTSDELRQLELDVREKASARGLAADVQVELAPAVGPAIVALARRDDASQIVVGTHGSSAITRAILGSVADYVVRHADCPVTTIRHGLDSAQKTVPEVSYAAARGAVGVHPPTR